MRIQMEEQVLWLNCKLYRRMLSSCFYRCY